MKDTTGSFPVCGTTSFVQPSTGASATVDLYLDSPLSSFSLKEVVTAIMSLIGKNFSKLKIKVTNLCADLASVVGNLSQLENILSSVLTGFEKALRGKCSVDVFIHDLKRPEDGAFLRHVLFDEARTTASPRSIKDSDLYKETRSQFLAISLRKTFEFFEVPESRSYVLGKEVTEEEIGYYDGGVLLKHGQTSVIVYISKSGLL